MKLSLCKVWRGNRLSFVKHLKCRECGTEYPSIMIHACEECFGPLEVVYHLEKIRIDRKSFEDRPRSIWRYHELLPIKNLDRTVDIGTGYTTLHRCSNLSDALGIRDLYIKDDTVNPTNSFKDRPSSIAVSKAIEFGAKAVGCPSTGNLAASVAAHAAKAGLPCYVFIPSNTEINKVLQAAMYGAEIIAVDGTYDEANRLAAQAGEEYKWALANVNLRPYYVEGSKTLAFEICEQLGWRAPDSVVIPLGSGALLCAMDRGFTQFRELGLVEDKQVRLIGAQAAGCAPIANAFKKGLDDVEPVEHPNTLAKSLAIGDPGDGYYTLKAIRRTGGAAEAVTDEEIVNAIKLLAETEGVFTEPAGGVTIAALKKLVEAGQILPEEEVVCCVTGSGFKAADTIIKTLSQPEAIEPSLEALSKHLRGI